MARESLLVATFVELADNLVDDFDIIDVLALLSRRCVDAIDVDAAGVMLASPGGSLQFIASSNESMRVLEVFQIQSNEGPCVDCYQSGKAIINQELTGTNSRWPNFTPRATALGFRSIHCLPMRLRGRTIGALNLFRTKEGLLDDDDTVLAQGLADVATITILQHRNATNAQTLNDQLNTALQSRIIIEQAKGKISQATGADMDEAFGRLRAHARNHSQGLTSLAAMVAAGSVSVSDLDPPPSEKSRARSEQMSIA
jgi:GAF domain-containing protein